MEREADLTDVEALFHEALEAGFSDAQERQAWLVERCDGNEELLREVGSLLLAFSETREILDGPMWACMIGGDDEGHGIPSRGAQDSQADPDSGSEQRVAEGEMIGDYEIRGVLGEGGMGVVYLAWQKSPIHREVALKLLKSLPYSRGQARRFERECEALSIMEHAHIAQVFDAGMTEQGDPFVVMERIEGAPITAYCEQRGLGLDDRLLLFRQVCAAVTHAHQKGILHRDLKPSNILVKEQDGRPCAKVIDFGLARPFSAGEEESGDLGEHAYRLGTPVYMSPEQARSSGEDLDTRSDVYSLGVLLYELLTGDLPIPSELLARTPPADIPRVIAEREFVPPSRRASRYRRRLRGDLDAITARALAGSRDERYASVSDFEQDLMRYARHETVSAAPSSGGDRARKWLRRNRVAAVGIAATLVALVGGLIGVSLLFFELRAETRNSDAVREFFQWVLTSPSPYVDGAEVPFVRVLDKAALEIGRRFEGRPLTEASVREAIGGTYLDLGQYQAAQEQFGVSLEIRRAQLGADDPLTLQSMNQYAESISRKGDFAGAESIFREILLRRERLGLDRTEQGISVRSNLAIALERQGRLEEAERLLRDAQGLFGEVLGERSARRGDSLVNLSQVLHSQQRYEEALAVASEAFEIHCERYTRGRPETIEALHNLVACLSAVGRSEESEALLQQALEIQRRHFPADHPATLTVLQALAVHRHNRGDLAGAEPLYRELIVSRGRVLSPEHPYTLGTVGSLAMLLARDVRHAEARSVFEGLFEVAPGVFSEASVEMLRFRRSFLDTLLAVGDAEAAETFFLASLSACEDELGTTHERTLGWLKTAADFYEQAGRPEESRKYRTRWREAGGR